MTKALTSIRLFGLGRNLIPAGVVTFLALLVCLRWWDLNIPVRLLGQFFPRWTWGLELACVLGGIIAIAMVAPKLPNTEVFAAPKQRAMGTAVALGTVFLALSNPYIMYWIYSSIPSEYLPASEKYFLEGATFVDLASLHLFAATSMTSATLLGLALAWIAVFGRYLGLLLSLLTYLGLILLQSTTWGKLLPLAGQIERTGEPLLAQGIIAGSSLLLGVIVWHFTRGAAPLTRHWRV